MPWLLAFRLAPIDIAKPIRQAAPAHHVTVKAKVHDVRDLRFLRVAYRLQRHFNSFFQLLIRLIPTQHLYLLLIGRRSEASPWSPNRWKVRLI